MNASSRPARLPYWTLLLVVAAGVVTYVAVGGFLLGPRFGDLQDFWNGVDGSTIDGYAPAIQYALLIIPAVIGGVWAREVLHVIFRGIRRNDSAGTIAKDVALHALGFVSLLIAAMYTSSRKSGY